MSKKRSPQPLTYDNIKNSLERHTSHEEGKLLLANLMNTGEVAVTSAILSLRCKVRLNLGNRARVP